MDSQQRQWVMKSLEQNERRLTAYVMRLMGGRLDQARDVVQHAFLKLCHQDRTAIGENVAAWLYRVCRNRAFDEMRKQKIMVEKNGFAAKDSHIVSEPAGQLEQAELMSGIQDLISELPDDQREAIDMWSHGIRFREIGEVLGKSEGAVRISVHRAIKQLRSSQIVRSHLAAGGQLAVSLSTKQ